jgi:hypothetical protein
MRMSWTTENGRLVCRWFKAEKDGSGDQEQVQEDVVVTIERWRCSAGSGRRSGVVYSAICQYGGVSQA